MGIINNEGVKESQLSGDGGSIVSKIIELENESKIEF